jgi:23S rRNA (uridine2552-2'-O)-methyltransferase
MKIKGERSLSSRLWLDRQINDPYVKRAHRDGYRSRAVFKLIEMDDKFHFIKNAKSIMDLGAAPGGWCQVLSQRSPSDARISAIDFLPFDFIDKVRQFCGDFENEDNRRKMGSYLGSKADLIVSDMAPSTTGHAQTDHIRIMRLAESVHAFARDVLEEEGTLVVKVFQGGREKSFLESLRSDFQKTCFFKPKSSRNCSVEIYVVATGFKKCN